MQFLVIGHNFFNVYFKTKVSNLLDKELSAEPHYQPLPCVFFLLIFYH